ncbi:unnamed protein product, partial [marine sediment metagenome]
YDDFQKRKEEEREHEKSDQEAFIEEFTKIQNDTIRPVFERIKVKIESRGHKVYIETGEPSWDAEKNLVVEPLISFNLELLIKEEKYKSQYYRTSDLPNLCFVCNSSAKKIWVRECTIGRGHGGHSGSRGALLTIEQVTEEIVEKKLLGWLEDLINDATPSYY